MNLSDLPAGLLDELVARARIVAPAAIGAFVFGSYVRGDATSASDLDLRAVTREQAATRYFTWFVGDLHVSLGISSLEQMRERAATPATWSLGFGVEAEAAWVWTTAAAVAALGDPPALRQPPDPPELEDFVEFCSKALRASDAIALRSAARPAAELAVALLRDLNDARTVETRAEAVRAAVAFTTAPEGWAADFLTAAGFEPADDARVRAAVRGLATGVLRLLRERRSGLGDHQPELTTYLLDGTLERLLGL